MQNSCIVATFFQICDCLLKKKEKRKTVVLYVNDNQHISV